MCKRFVKKTSSRNTLTFRSVGMLKKQENASISSRSHQKTSKE